MFRGWERGQDGCGRVWGWSWGWGWIEMRSRCDRDAIEMRTSHLADVVEGAVQVHVGLHVHDDHARLAVGALGRLDVPGEGEGWG